jgi:hypothetical protein
MLACALDEGSAGKALHREGSGVMGVEAILPMREPTVIRRQTPWTQSAAAIDA